VNLQAWQKNCTFKSTKVYFTAMQFRFLLCLFFLGVIFGAQAQDNTPKYSNEFLQLGAGARGMVLGATMPALTDDVSSAYWNPAGLLQVEDKFQVGLMHAAYFGNIANYDYAGFTTRPDSSSRLAFTLLRFGVDDIPDTRFLIDDNGNINYDNVGSFAEASYAFMTSYARQLKIKWKTKPDSLGNREEKEFPLRFGASAKVIHRRAGPFGRAWGFGLDVGLQSTRGPWELGLVLRDVTSTFNAWSYNTETFADVFANTGNEIPENSLEITLPRLLLSAGRRVDFTPQLQLLAALGFEATFDGQRNTLISSASVSAAPHVGLELGYRDMVFLRGGLGNFQQIQNFDGQQEWNFQPGFGLGFKYRKVTVDYALTQINQSLGLPYTHVFSLRIDFNEKDLEFMKKPQP
jgi:hypothetical protein